ncbi:TRAP transporter substrate-binding protein DctP [Enterocloster sp.]|uniref:TRAP transporter substrate-binding protein DctP n=1 Tax=Enterocloster sp. TaxID=2719315 RepID=UPI0039A0BB46
MGFRQLTANKEIHSPADLKGVKIRTMVDPIQMNCWEAFGASVTPVPYAELYTAPSAETGRCPGESALQHCFFQDL